MIKISFIMAPIINHIDYITFLYSIDYYIWLHLNLFSDIKIYKR